MTHTFIISDDKVNNYGFRMIPSGISLVQYERNPVVLHMHKRGDVIGRAKVYLKDEKLLADVEFDMEDEFAAKIAGKVKRGFLKMTSIWARVIESSNDPKLMLEGQTGETITKSKLRELSIVDIGVDDDALKLSDESGNEIKLADFGKSPTQDTNTNQTQEMSNKNIAIALGLTAEATEGDILSSINEFKSDKVLSDKKLADFETAQKSERSAEAGKLIDRAVKLGLYPESIKETYVKLFDADYSGTRTSLEAEIAAKETPADGKADNVQLSDKAAAYLDGLGKNGNTNPKTDKKLADYSDQELDEMLEKEPKKFAKLMDGYEGTIV